MKIKNLIHNESGWEWSIQYEPDDYEYNSHYQINEFPNIVEYRTNKDGEGLWMQKEKGIIIDDKHTVMTEMKQIEGTGQYSMARCNSYSSAYNHIKKYMQ